jgi:hypothetical protein
MIRNMVCEEDNNCWQEDNRICMLHGQKYKLHRRNACQTITIIHTSKLLG